MECPTCFRPARQAPISQPLLGRSLHMKLTRRHSLTGLGAALAARTALAADPAGTGLAGDLARIEAGIGGRLGVAVHDTGSGQHHNHRSDERFPMCSTFKVLACAAVLARVDMGQEDLSRRIRFEASDVVTYSPVTKDRVGGDGMALADLCEAGMTQSDNTAGNLILASLGGPSGVTAYARTLGDIETRLDRTETGLNDAIPGDPWRSPRHHHARRDDGQPSGARRWRCTVPPVARPAYGMACR